MAQSISYFIINKAWCAIPALRAKAMIFLIICLFVAAAGYGQKITFSVKNMPLVKVFAEIKKQTGYVFFYNETLLSNANLITAEAKDANIREALTLCFRDQPLDFVIENKTVIITEKARTAPQLQPVDDTLNMIPVLITGKVSDEDNMPLAGASLKIKGRNIGISTNADGLFILKKVYEDAIVQVSYVGFLTQETVIQKNKNFIAVVLKKSPSPLDEVQVIAYGTNSKRFSVGSVSTVKAAEIQKQPVTNVLLALEGRVPGLYIAPTSGIPGAAVKVQLRGKNSLQSSMFVNNKPFDQPLFIVDGTPMAAQNGNTNLLSSLGTGLVDAWANGGGFSPLNTINPADIESISFLKDADATFIYGTQGANGVIIINTKKGKAGKTSVDISVNTGITISARPVKMLNTQQYLDLRREAFKNDHITLLQGTDPYADGYAPDLTIFDQHKSTDWYHNLTGKTTGTTNAHVSLSGGSAATNFIVSGGITNVGYNFPGNYADNQFTLHSGFQHASPNNRMNINFTSDLGYDRNNSAL